MTGSGILCARLSWRIPVGSSPTQVKLSQQPATEAASVEVTKLMEPVDQSVRIELMGSGILFSNCQGMGKTGGSPALYNSFVEILPGSIEIYCAPPGIYPGPLEICPGQSGIYSALPGNYTSPLEIDWESPGIYPAAPGIYPAQLLKVPGAVPNEFYRNTLNLQ